MININNSSLFSRMTLWVNERFPLANTPLFFILWFLSFSVAMPAQESISPVKIALGCLLSLSFFLLLRVLDGEADEVERAGLPEIAEGEHAGEDRLQTGVLALLRKEVHLQESLVRLLLNLNEVRNRDRCPDS